MQSQKLFLGLCLPAVFLFSSCGKDNTVPGVTYQVSTAASTPAVIVGTAGNGSLKWISGFANVVEIEFEAMNNNVEVEYKSVANQKINFFSPFSTLGVIAVPPGTYDDVEFEIEVQPIGTEPALLLNGSYTSNGTTTPVSFKLNAELEIETKQARVAITDGGSFTAFTTLNLSLITTGVTVSMLDDASRTNGTIEISATSNAQIYDIIVKNLKECGGVKID